MTSAERRDVVFALLTVGAILAVALLGIAWATLRGAVREVWDWAKGGTS